MASRLPPLLAHEVEVFGRDIIGVLAPTVIAALWIWALKPQSSEIPVAVFVAPSEEVDQRLRADALVRAISNSERTGRVVEVDDVREIDNLMRRNEISVGIVVEVIRDDEKASRSRIVVEADGTNPVSVLDELRQIERGVSMYLDSSNDPDRRYRVELRARYNPRIKSAYLLLPGLAVLLGNWVAMVLACVSVMRERPRALSLYLRSLPIRPWERVASKTLVASLLGMISFFFIVIVCGTLFGVDVPGPIPLVMLAGGSSFSILSSALIGVLVGWRTRTDVGSVMSIGLLLLLTFFLSGWWSPTYELPAPLQVVALCLPVTHHVPIAKSLLLRGGDLGDVASYVIRSAVVCLFGFVLSVLAARRPASQ